MRVFFVAVILAVAAVGVLAQAPNPPPIWPAQFQARFGVSDSIVIGGSIVNETSYIYYNIDITAQLLDYPERCPASPDILTGSKSACKLLFLETGIYLNQPAENIDCCLLFAGVGPTPRNFTRGMDWQGQDQAADFYGDIHQCDYYTNGGIAPFKYWTEVGTHHDVMFHDGAGANWAWDHLNVTAQDPSIFELFADPQTCAKGCGLSAEHHAEMQYRASQHSLIQLALHHHELSKKEEAIVADI
jgi:hypothetical protein